MAQAHPGMTPGTYYLKGGDDGASLLANAKIIYDAFGGINCRSDNTLITTSYNVSYNPSPFSYFRCEVSGLYAGAGWNGSVNAGDGAGSDCQLGGYGVSNCEGW